VPTSRARKSTATGSCRGRASFAPSLLPRSNGPCVLPPMCSGRHKRRCSTQSAPRDARLSRFATRGKSLTSAPQCGGAQAAHRALSSYSLRGRLGRVTRRSTAASRGGTGRAGAPLCAVATEAPHKGRLLASGADQAPRHSHRSSRIPKGTSMKSIRGVALTLSVYGVLACGSTPQQAEATDPTDPNATPGAPSASQSNPTVAPDGSKPSSGEDASTVPGSDAGAPFDGAAPSVRTCAVATSGTSTCACKSDGSLWCWGDNGKGQLGNGTTDRSLLPIAVPGIGRVIDVVVLQRTTCALAADGAVWCWGSNMQGLLGNGSTVDSSSPVRVTGLGTSVAQISGGQYGNGHICARKGDGTAWCWGSGSYGELGNGAQAQSLTPVQANIGTSVLSIAAGGAHTCALKTDRTVWCWGNGSYGQLGGGMPATAAVPTQIVSLGATVSELASGSLHSCAVKLDGTLWCWGLNSHGQIGDGTSQAGSNRFVPTQVTPLSNTAKSVAAGGHHTCATTSNGSVFCWGANNGSQFGNGTTVSSTVPVRALFDNASMVSAGGDMMGSTSAEGTCARKGDGSTWCWGGNYAGQVGDGTAVARSTPVRVLP
jgi:alpha-tubulin suppressor-like RCC1 family protein